MYQSTILLMVIALSFVCAQHAQSQDTTAVKGKVYVPEIHADSVQEMFLVFEERAEFKQGVAAMYQFIGQYIEIPDSVYKLDTGSFMVLVSFVVEKDGGLSQIQIDKRSKKTYLALEEASLNIVKKMDGMWKPAIQRGEPVLMRFTLPIKFLL